MTYSGLESFVEAVNFGTYVLWLPVSDPSVPIVSNFVKGILDKKALARPRRKQARPLTVSEVIYLESVLRNSSIDLVDRFAAGAFLFALFGRCRWSDLRHVNNFFLDTNEVDGRTIGYMEFTTFSHKTAAQVARHGLPCPWWPRFGGSKNHVVHRNGTRLPRRSAEFSMTLSKVPSYQRQISLATGDQGASPLQRHQVAFGVASPQRIQFGRSDFP